MSSAVLKKGLEQEVQYIRWCKETIELVESCPALWSGESNAAAEAYEIRFSEVEPAFLRYFGELLED